MIVQSVRMGRMVCTLRDGGAFAREVRNAVAGLNDALMVKTPHGGEVTIAPLLLKVCPAPGRLQGIEGIAVHETTAGTIVNVWPHQHALFADDRDWRAGLQCVRVENAETRELDPRWARLFCLEWADIPHDEERVTAWEAPAPPPAPPRRRHPRNFESIRQWVRVALAFRSAP